MYYYVNTYIGHLSTVRPYCPVLNGCVVYCIALCIVYCMMTCILYCMILSIVNCIVLCIVNCLTRVRWEKCCLLVRLFPLDSLRRTAAADKEGPRFCVLLLFSFWLCMLRSPAGTPSHKGLDKHQEKTLTLDKWLVWISWHYVTDIKSNLTWQCLRSWFTHKAPGPNDFHLQSSFLFHHSDLNVTWARKTLIQDK